MLELVAVTTICGSLVNAMFKVLGALAGETTWLVSDPDGCPGPVAQASRDAATASMTIATFANFNHEPMPAP